ncbi:MAG: tRNA pseudouridine(38-40) synthase TruA [Chlamydiales bacterium]|nr:tRNA pseudouridine(38-40) synthase TruA [Chlamydiales bacterium]
MISSIPLMNCYRLTLTYDGTRYSGWQVQPNSTTIQEILEKAVETLLKKHLTVIGAGRTDAGVHAFHQVAHFHTDIEFDIGKFLTSLNGILPPSIRVLDVALAPPHFHSRYSAIGKEYHYRLSLDRFQSPFDRPYSWHVRRLIDVKLLIEAAKLFVGTHDFTSFANEAHTGCAANDAVRTITRLDVVSERGGVRLEFEGNGFLYKMVRNITGTLVEVATGKKALDDIEKILAAKDRRLAGRAAPAYGLFLVKVTYPEVL